MSGRNGLAAAAVVIVSLAFASNAAAATVTVNTTADQNFVNDSNCSLREAIALTNANTATIANGCTAVGSFGGDTIDFSPGLDGSTLQLVNAGGSDDELLVTDTDGLTIDGPGTGPSHLIIQAAPTHRVIESTGSVPLTLNDLSVKNGSDPESGTSGATASGGGIKAGGDLTLNRVLVTNNTVTATATGTSGNADAGGGGIDATNGTLTITDSTISGNSATADNQTNSLPGNALSEGGGVVAFNSTISDTTISGNTASATDEHGTQPGDSAHTNGGGIANAGQLSLDHSTVSANQALGAALEGGAGGLIIGGGVFFNGTTGSIELSTIANNTTTAGANSGDIGGGAGSFGALTMGSDTIDGNGPSSLASTSSSANLFPNGSMTMKNTIVADPRGASSTNCSSAVASTGFNIDSDNSCGLGQTTDQHPANAMLGILQDNGGPTKTMLPGAGGDAIDKGSSNGQADTSHDQRGLGRPVNSVTVTGDPGDGSDVGAVEVQAPARPTVDSTSPTSPSNSVTNPHVIGTVPDVGEAEGADSGSSSVHLYSDAACTTGLTGGTDTPANFASPGIQPTLTANTTTTIYARTFNTYGIPSPCSSTFQTYTHDALGPVITIDPLADSTDHTPSFTFHSPDTSTPLTFQCSVDSGTPATCASPFTAPSLADGAHTFAVTGTDSLGNVGSPATQSFTLTTPPTPTPPAPSPPATKKKCKKAKKGSASAAKKKCKKKK